MAPAGGETASPCRHCVPSPRPHEGQWHPDGCVGLEPKPPVGTSQDKREAKPASS